MEVFSPARPVRTLIVGYVKLIDSQQHHGVAHVLPERRAARRACREQAVCPKALSIVLSFFSWRELCRCVWTPAITAPLSNPSHEHKTRLKALSETEGKCVVGT